MDTSVETTTSPPYLPELVWQYVCEHADVPTTKQIMSVCKTMHGIGASVLSDKLVEQMNSTFDEMCKRYVICLERMRQVRGWIEMTIKTHKNASLIFRNASLQAKIDGEPTLGPFLLKLDQLRIDSGKYKDGYLPLTKEVDRKPGVVFGTTPVEGKIDCVAEIAYMHWPPHSEEHLPYETVVVNALGEPQRKIMKHFPSIINNNTRPQSAVFDGDFDEIKSAFEASVQAYCAAMNDIGTRMRKGGGGGCYKNNKASCMEPCVWNKRCKDPLKNDVGEVAPVLTLKTLREVAALIGVKVATGSKKAELVAKIVDALQGKPAKAKKQAPIPTDIIANYDWKHGTPSKSGDYKKNKGRYQDAYNAIVRLGKTNDNQDVRDYAFVPQVFKIFYDGVYKYGFIFGENTSKIKIIVKWGVHYKSKLSKQAKEFLDYLIIFLKEVEDGANFDDDDDIQRIGTERFVKRKHDGMDMFFDDMIKLTGMTIAKILSK